MNLSRIFIERPVMTTLVMVTFLLLGLMSYFRLPISNLPDVNYPTIEVKVALPGSSPDTIAKTVATPLEREFMTIPGVTEVTSANTLGNSSLVIQFEVNKNIDAAAQDVQAAISRAKTRLPPNLPNDPTYRKVNPSDSPILYIAVLSDTMSLGELYTYANTYIGEHISMIDGVAQVIAYGSPYAVRVQVDPGALAARDLSLQDVAATTRAGNPILPTGQLDGVVRASPILAQGQLVKASEYDPLVISYSNSAAVRIKDLGKTKDSLQNSRQRLIYSKGDRRSNGVVLAVQRQPDANTVQVADAITSFLPTLMEQLPGSIDLDIVFDRAESIRDSIHEVNLTLVAAFLLVIAVIFFFLGQVTETIIPSLAMPMSLVFTFIVMYLCGFSLDNLSLLGLTLAIGFIVDDAIVVQENIVRWVENGEQPHEAALKGSAEISTTVVSMTLSLVAIFIPMLFMGGLIGKIFREFSIVLAVVTLASGVIALSLTPMLCAHFVRRREHSRTSFFSRLSQRINERMLSIYKPVLHKALSYPKLIVAVGLLSVVVSGVLFKVLPTDFIPDEDIGFIIGYAEAAQGTSSERMWKYQDTLIEAFTKNPQINTIVSIVANTQYRQGINFIRLANFGQRKSSIAIIQELYRELIQIPGVNVFLKNVPLIDLAIGSTSRGAYQFTLQGQDPDDLYLSADHLLERLSTDPIFQGVNSDLEINTPQLNVDILRDEAYALGVNAEDIQNTLLLAYSGNRVSKIQSPVDQFDVIVELEDQYQMQASDLNAVYVRSNTASLVPLDTVASWEEGIGLGSVNHINQFPAVTITFNIAPTVPLGTALAKLRSFADETLIPGVVGNMKGAAETFETAIQSAAVLFLFAIIAIYIVLGILYESFIHPITVLSTLPPAVLGGLLTLYVFGLPLSLYGYLGLILLIGIVKKNGIMMVDYAIEYQETRGLSPLNAIVEASLVRFRPIMMTTVAAIAGAIPIILATGAGSASRRPLGMVIIGGLLISQLVTLLLTPVVYVYLAPSSEHSELSGAPK